MKTFKRKSGPDRSVSDNQSSSVTLNELAMKVRKSYCNFLVSAKKSYNDSYKSKIGSNNLNCLESMIFSDFS